jgi:hypothetical protein
MLPYWDSTIDAEMTDPTDSVIWTNPTLPIFMTMRHGETHEAIVTML